MSVEKSKNQEHTSSNSHDCDQLVVTEYIDMCAAPNFASHSEPNVPPERMFISGH